MNTHTTYVKEIYEIMKMNQKLCPTIIEASNSYLKQKHTTTNTNNNNINKNNLKRNSNSSENSIGMTTHESGYFEDNNILINPHLETNHMMAAATDAGCDGGTTGQKRSRISSSNSDPKSGYKNDIKMRRNNLREIRPNKRKQCFQVKNNDTNIIEIDDDDDGDDDDDDDVIVVENSIIKKIFNNSTKNPWSHKEDEQHQKQQQQKWRTTDNNFDPS